MRCINHALILLLFLLRPVRILPVPGNHLPADFLPFVLLLPLIRLLLQVLQVLQIQDLAALESAGVLFLVSLTLLRPVMSVRFPIVTYQVPPSAIAPVMYSLHTAR